MQKPVGGVEGTDNSRLKNCQSEAEFIDRQLKKKSRVLSSHLCRRPMNVIIQKSMSNLSRAAFKKTDEKVPDTDLFLTKIGLDDYNFTDELIKNDDGKSDDQVEIDEDDDVDDEAEKKLNQLNQHSKQMQAGL